MTWVPVGEDRMSRLCATLAALIGFSQLGCSAILNPENSDEVLRCGNADDCLEFEEIAAVVGDKRTQATCAAPGGDGSGDFTEAKENQVCSVTDFQLSCAIKSYGGDESTGNAQSNRIYVQTFTEAINKAGLYIPCAEDRRGSRGCKAKLDSTCDTGLSLNAFGACDVANPEAPAVEPTPDLKALDVRDQFCRSYFWDDDFVCASSGTSNYLCKRCDPAAPIGQGGCAQLYFGGAPSTVYTDHGDAGRPAEANVDKVEFGPFPTP